MKNTQKTINSDNMPLVKVILDMFRSLDNIVDNNSVLDSDVIMEAIYDIDGLWKALEGKGCTPDIFVDWCCEYGCGSIEIIDFVEEYNSRVLNMSNKRTLRQFLSSSK